MTKWRYNRKLWRNVNFRPIEDEDVKYLWAAYKQGAFDFEKRDMTATEFKSAFESAVVSNCHAVWTLFGQTRKGYMPTGLVFASWAPNGPFLIVTGVVWMPWASKRNIIECMIFFLRGIRWKFPLQFYVLQEHKKLYEVCKAHGVITRAGTSFVAIPGKQVAIFESRIPDHN